MSSPSFTLQNTRKELFSPHFIPLSDIPQTLLISPPSRAGGGGDGHKYLAMFRIVTKEQLLQLLHTINSMSSPTSSQVVQLNSLVSQDRWERNVSDSLQVNECKERPRYHSIVMVAITTICDQ